MKKINWKLLLISLAIPLGVGLLSALLTRNSFQIYSDIEVPFFAPPGWLFAPVWIVLYTLMGISLYRILISNEDKKEQLLYFGLQLFFNFAWPIAFFNFRLFWFAFVWIIGLIYLIVRTIISFNKIDKFAGWLQILYLLWTIFAAVLNLAIAILN